MPKELLNYLKNYLIEYQTITSFSTDINFGIEIEAIPNNPFLSKWDIINLLPELLDYEYAKYDDNPYDYWVLKTDDTIEKENGYEIASKILKNNESSWKQIQTITDTLKPYFHVDELCSAQIHFDAERLIGEDANKLINILKMWTLYEDILFRFSYGEFNGPRKLISSFAVPIAKNTYKKFIKQKDFSYENTLNTYIGNKYNSLNLTKIPTTRGTIEVRMPNGTLNKTIWQNLINTFGHFLEYSVSNNFDDEKTTYEIRNMSFPKKSLYTTINDYSKPNLPKALELADTIFDSDLDKLNFLRQYLKDDVFSPTPTLDICENKMVLSKKITY